MTRYIATVGMNTPSGRFEIGDEVKGIPAGSVKRLLKRGAITEEGAKAEKPKPATPKGGE